MEHRDDTRGFTLVELMAGMAISAIVVLAVYYGVIYRFGRVAQDQHRVGLQRDADNAAYWIELVLREGSWAYLDSEGTDSLTVDNFSQSLQKRIYADGARLLVDAEGTTHEVIDNLQNLDFSVYMDRVEYELTVAEDEETVTLGSTKQFRNLSCVGLWHFSEGTGGMTYDMSANNNSVAIYGPSWVPGFVGFGLSFDGVDDYLEVPDNPDLQSGQRIAIGAAVRTNSGGLQSILSRESPGGTRVRLYLNGDDLHYAFGDSRDVSAGSLTWNAEQWYEVCVQHDGPAGRVHFYRNGNKVGSATGSLPAMNDGDLYIGSRGGTSEFWDGSLDEVRFSSY